MSTNDDDNVHYAEADAMVGGAEDTESKTDDGADGAAAAATRTDSDFLAEKLAIATRRGKPGATAALPTVVEADGDGASSEGRRGPSDAPTVRRPTSTRTPSQRLVAKLMRDSQTGPGASPSSSTAAATYTASGTAAATTAAAAATAKASDRASGGIGEKEQALAATRIKGPKTAAAAAAFRARRKDSSAAKSVGSSGETTSTTATKAIGYVKSGKTGRPETISVREPPHPAYHQAEGQDSEEEKQQEIAAADVEAEKGSMISSGGCGRDAVRGALALQEGGSSSQKEARVNDAGDSIPAAGSPASSEVRPGAVAVSNMGSSNEAISHLSPYDAPTTDHNAAANVDGHEPKSDRDAATNVDDEPKEIAVTVEAYAVEEDEAPMPAMATVVERKTICGIDRGRFGWVLAAMLVILIAVITGTMASRGVEPTSSPTVSPVPTAPSPAPTVSPTDSPTITPMPTASSAPTECTASMKLLAEDGAVDDWFGCSIALDGDTAVVGAKWDDDNGSDSGGAYVFTRIAKNTKWTLQAKLHPEDGAAKDRFGLSVAVFGDTAIVGAHSNDDNGGNSGSAYIFTRTGTDWTQQFKLLPDDGAAGDQFGYSVAVYGGTAVVGARKDDETGSAYVFTRTGTNWSQQAKLVPGDGAVDDEFGTSVALYNNTAIVGADEGDNKGSGKAYVFTREGTDWTQPAKLLPENGAAGDNFGFSVALDDGTAIIGAFGDGDNGSNSGSAYVFARTGTNWTQQAKLLPDDGGWGAKFGEAVAVRGDTAVIGADDDDNDGAGKAYVFARTGTTWAQQKKLRSDDGASGDRFGGSVAVDGTTVLVGAYRDDDNGEDSGGAFAFELC